MMKIAADDTIPKQAINSPTPSLSLFLALSSAACSTSLYLRPPLSIIYSGLSATYSPWQTRRLPRKYSISNTLEKLTSPYTFAIAHPSPLNPNIPKSQPPSNYNTHNPEND